MIKITNKNSKEFTLQAIIGSKVPNGIIKKNNNITDDISNKKSFVYFEKDLNLHQIKAFATMLAKANRNYQVDIETFVNKDLKEEEIISVLIETYEFINNKIVYNAKTKKKSDPVNIFLINVSAKGKASAQKAKLYIDTINYVRNFQTTPPNLLNSEVFAKQIKKDLIPYKNLTVKVLDKKQIQALGMGLLLSVNSASQYEARVVVVEYKGESKNKDKTTLIGKGITFDAGGMNIKTGGHMSGMKYDMSGAAIAIGVMKAIAQLKPKKNFSAVVALTDNMVSATASQPDSVYKAMNGKTVEVNNTDAEGRLVMADALTYAVEKLKATRVIDIATLTGAIVVSLGNTYTGVWSTTEKGWEDLKAASKKANELVWRMPLHNDFFKMMKSSKIADMYNTDTTRGGGASSAAMFLTQFSQGVEHIHLDIAGTADIKNESMGPMVKTLIELTNAN